MLLFVEIICLGIDCSIAFGIVYTFFACALQLKNDEKKNQQVVPKILTVMNSPIVQSTNSDIVS